jgi:RNA polymerase sigma-70 factor (ECF subfamily)
MTTTAHTGSTRRQAGGFVATRWSVVLSARDRQSPQSTEALETLCRAYWYPLYAFVRRQGHSPPDAQDLTQEFFARLLQKDFLKAVARDKGRFRTFLLVALKRFLANEWHRAHAAKRGGCQTRFSLDAELAERRYGVEPVEKLTADRIYERRWALTLLDTTLARLQQEFAAAGKAEQFERLKGFLTTEADAAAGAKAAAALGMSEGALRVTVHRLRRRFGELFRKEIAHTVAVPAEVDAELRHLMEVLGE